MLKEELEAFVETASLTAPVPERLLENGVDTAHAVLDLVGHVFANSSEQDEDVLNRRRQLCTVIAEVCKGEDARACLTETQDVIRAVHTSLAKTCDPANATAKAHPDLAIATIIQSLRAIGNLCFDNSRARQALRDTGGIGALATALDALVKHAAAVTAAADSDNKQDGAQLELRAGPGSVLNAAGDNEEVRKDLVEAGVVPNLMWLLANAPSDTEKAIAFNALLRLESVDKAVEQMAQPEHLLILVSRLSTCDNTEDAEALGELLKKIADHDKYLPGFSRDRAVIEQLVATARQVDAQPEDADAVPVPKARVVAAVTVAILLSDNGCLEVLWADDTKDATLAMLLSWLRPAAEAAAQRRSNSKSDDSSSGGSSGSSSGSEKQQGQQEEEGQQQLQGSSSSDGARDSSQTDTQGDDSNPAPLSLLSDPAARMAVDRAVAGLIGIGNVCRSDDNARALGDKDGLMAATVLLCTHPLSFVQHAALGALNNLVKLQDNKPKALSAGALDALTAVLFDPQGPLQYLACSCLRILASAGEAHRDLHRHIATDARVRERVVHLTKSEVMAARGEAMRLLATVVKTARVAELIVPIATNGGVDAFVRMLQEEHPLFKCEGMIGLAVVSAAGDECEALLLTNDMHALNTAFDQVEKTEMVELGLNFLALAVQLLQSRPELAATDVLQRARAFADSRLSLVPEPAVMGAVRQFKAAMEAAGQGAQS